MPQCRLAEHGRADRMLSPMIRFSLFGQKAHVHLSFWLAALAMGIALTGCQPHPMGVFYFVVALFISMLWHEVGHAVMKGRIGECETEICIDMLGSHTSTEEPVWMTNWQYVAFQLMGPAMTMLAVLGCVAVFFAITQTPQEAMELGLRMLRGEAPLEYAGECPPLLLLFAVYFWQINVAWTVFNLLPLYPMDGGALLLEIFEDKRLRAVVYGVCVVVSLAVALLFFALGIWAISLLMVVLTMYNYYHMTGSPAQKRD